MTPENFIYWLNGFVELNDNPPTPEQWQSIKEHLSLVMNKVTPPVAKSAGELYLEHIQKVTDQYQQEAPEWQKELLRSKIIC